MLKDARAKEQIQLIGSLSPKTAPVKMKDFAPTHAIAQNSEQWRDSLRRRLLVWIKSGPRIDNSFTCG
jgi:hypothetical protein